VKIPQIIADRMRLNYVPIFLEEKYQSTFSTYSNLAVLLSDGAAEFSHGNIPYVYSNYLIDKTSILTGLFGSELIKTPSSRGLFLDTNSIALLTSRDPAGTMRSIFDQMDESGVTLPFFDKETREEVIEMVQRHPYITNDLPDNEKFFYYLLMVGVRKYFRKETKIQRFWKDNLHPFFDIEFVSKLLETPFPWVYNFSQKKSLIRNISIHKLYGSIINENPVLKKIVSTHGYRPGHLTHPLGAPMLAWEYFRNKKAISSATTLSFQQNLALKQLEENKDALCRNSGFSDGKFLADPAVSAKTLIKIGSLQSWYRSVGLSM
jgi:general stress protein 26